MRKITTFLIAIFLGAAVCWAIPADKTLAKVKQSDGTTLMLRLVGDEFFHYNTTEDGYTVLKTENGDYQYAVKQGNVLVASGMVAHNAQLRSAHESNLLQQVGKHLRSSQMVTTAQRNRARAARPTIATAKAPTVDYSNFRGLIVLINYTDRQFGMSNPYDFYDKMVNQEGFDHFDFNGRRQNCTGSMHDYFKEQSGGIFAPSFDIVGPVNVNFASTDHNSTNNSWRIFKAALDAVNSDVDFSVYDNNHDGEIDMVYFLVAGYSANYSGNNSGYLWPHQSVLYDRDSWSYLYYDNKRMGRYASSTEIYGWESQGYPMPLGIGTMCHEFSHALGLPDLYDTNYSEEGQSHDPGEWDVMASGGSYNYGRTPCAYSIWERYALGWATPTEIKSTGDYQLNYVGTSYEGFIMRSPIRGEFFMLDNRQKTRWDTYLPGHGMLVVRVDSTNQDVWDNNAVNALAERNYYELLRAGNTTSGANASDPFPGTLGNSELSFVTQPSLKTWDGLPLDFMLTNIRENNGVIYFTVAGTPNRESAVETFELMPVTTSTTATDVRGDFALWSFTKASVAQPSQDYCDGQHACGIVSGGKIEMTTDIQCHPYQVSLRVSNPTTAIAKLKLSCSYDQGQTWEEVDTEAREVAARSDETISWNLTADGTMRFRINMVGGSKNSKTYLDNFAVHYTGAFESLMPEGLKGDVNGDGVVDVADVNLIISIMLGKTAAVPAADVNGDGIVDVSDANLTINIMLGK